MFDVAPREVTPPPIQAPSDRERKYDRQLRLWAAAGQRALEESHVLLVVGEGGGSNSSVAGVETLKNLILPSIGHFTIADAAVVSESDMGINFFLVQESRGKSRAEETTKYLQELNPDVQGRHISRPLLEWLPEQDSLKPYNLILACAPLTREQLQRLSSYALEQAVPLIYVHSAGFYSTASIQLPEEFPIVETHPDPDTVQDLRLLTPWGELKAAEEELGDLTQLSDHDHGHVPWLLILLRYLKEWKQSHAGNYPEKFEEKTEFRSLVASKARTNNPEGGEENFDEACAAVLKSISPPSPGDGCRKMFELSSCTELKPGTPNFWIIANAIKQFYDKHSVLPLQGGLPDMKATSAGYVKLQAMYKSKARADAAEVTATVRKLEMTQGRSKHQQMPASEIEQFCKNAAFVRVLRNPNKQPLPELRLMQSDAKTLAKLPEMLTEFDTISEVFLAMNVDHVPSSTLVDLKKVEDHLMGGTIEDRVHKAIQEFRRCQDAEMHNTSSITGGIVAQEAIKLITRQYVPVDGVAVWDGIRSKTGIAKI